MQWIQVHNIQVYRQAENWNPVIYQLATSYQEQDNQMVKLWMVNQTTLIVKVLRPTRHKIGYFEDILPSQSLGLVHKDEI